MSPSQSANHPVGLGFHTLRGGINPGDLRFVPGLLDFYMYGRISYAGMGNYPPWGALALCAIPCQSAIGQWDWGSHTVRDGFDPGIRVFVPGLSEL